MSAPFGTSAQNMLSGSIRTQELPTSNNESFGPSPEFSLMGIIDGFSDSVVVVEFIISTL
jgi:hypothetical protein